MSTAEYRVWDKKNKEMFYPIMIDTRDVMEWKGEQVNYYCWHQISQTSGDGYWVDVSAKEMMKLTDSKDEQDNHIYEGDIFYIGNNKKVLYKVIWVHNGFHYNELCRKDFRWTLLLPTNPPESRIHTPMHVIGNIYENYRSPPNG